MKRIATFLFAICLVASATSKAQDESTADVNKSVMLLPDFVSGKVHFRNGNTQQAEFNYNRLFQQIIYRQKGLILALDKSSAVDTVYVGSRIFVPIDTFFCELNAPQLRQPLLTKYSCRVSRTAPSSAYFNTSQTGPVQDVTSFRFGVATPYELKVPDNFTVENQTTFNVLEDDKLVQIKNVKSLQKLFPDKEDDIKGFVKDNNIDFKKQADVEKVLVFCQGKK